MTTAPVLLVLAAYAAGAIPSAFWIGRACYGKDLRALGSGNLGATNAYRSLSPLAGVFVVLFDAFKGFAPVWWFPQWDGRDAGSWAVAYGGAAVLGHVFSFWVRFRGGKGVATSAGVLAALAPGAVLAGFAAWLAVLLGTRIVSLASIAGAVAVPLSAWLLPTRFLPEQGPVLRGFLVAVGLFVVWAHRSNIRRLLAGTEERIGRAGSAAAPGDSA